MRALGLSASVAALLALATAPFTAWAASYQKTDGSVVDPVLCFVAFPGVCAAAGDVHPSVLPDLVPSGGFEDDMFLEGADLQDADLANVNIPRGRFDGANLSNANLSGGSFAEGLGSTQTSFNSAILTGASLVGTRLDYCDLRRANFSFADLTDVRLQAAMLADAILFGANLTGVVASAGGNEAAIFSRADLRFANLTLGSFVRVRFDDALLDGATIIDASLTGAEFSGASLIGATLIGSDLSTADFTGADLTGANLLAVNLQEARTGPLVGSPSALPPGYFALSDFIVGPWVVASGGDFVAANFDNLDLTLIVMGNASLMDATFVNASLLGADLGFSNLSGADFTGAYLQSVGMVDANLSGADLTSADVYRLRLTGALYDDLTLFPSGNTYHVSPWGLDGGIAPWDAGMIPAPEPSSGWMVMAGAAALAGLRMMKGGG